MRKKGSFFRRNTEKRRQDSGDSDAATSQPSIHGRRRNVYVNMPLPTDEKDSHGEPVVRYARNKVRTSSAYFSSPSSSRAAALSPQSTRSSPSFLEISTSNFVGGCIFPWPYLLFFEADLADCTVVPLFGSSIACWALQRRPLRASISASMWTVYPVYPRRCLYSGWELLHSIPRRSRRRGRCRGRGTNNVHRMASQSVLIHSLLGILIPHRTVGCVASS